MLNLKYLKVSQCSGNGQGSCRGCSEKGIWNSHWMTFLFHIEGLDGCFCKNCVLDLDKLMGIYYFCCEVKL